MEELPPIEQRPPMQGLRIGFISRQICERGTETALFDYADFAERLLGAVSFVLYDATSCYNVASAIAKFRERFGERLIALRSHTELEAVFDVNTTGVLRVSEAFLDNVLASEQKKIITLSSTVGSLQESLIPAFAYCTSKTAVTKAVQLLAEVLRERNIIAMAFCPGHVKTRMGAMGGTVEIPDSVSGMRGLIAGFTLEDAGTFRRYNGETVAW